MQKTDLNPLNQTELKDFFKGFLSQNEVPACFLKSYMTLDTHLNRIRNRLYKLACRGDDFLVVKKIDRHDYGFLFKLPSKQYLKEFVDEFNPNYVSAHYLNPQLKTLDDEFISIEQEAICSTNIFEDKSNLKKELSQSKRYNENIYPEHFDYFSHIAELLLFLEEWRHSRTIDQNLYAKIENDINFVVSFEKLEETKVLLLRDRENNNKLVAFTCYVELNTEPVKTSISVLSKVSRAYRGLGVLLKHFSFEDMRLRSIEETILGSINNEFKKKFVTRDPIQLLEKELFIKEEYKGIIRNQQRYLSNYLW